MKRKYNIVIVAIVLLIIIGLLLGCSINEVRILRDEDIPEIVMTDAPTSEIEPTDIPETNDDFLNIINKQIIAVTKDEPYEGEIDVDITWLEEQLGESQLCEIPTDILALLFRIVIAYDDGTTSLLRLLNDREGVCALNYNGKSYCFKNDEIAQWFLNESSQNESISSEDTPEIDVFTELINKQISKVKIDLPTGNRAEASIDIKDLQNELMKCEECEIPSDSDKKGLVC